MQNLIDVLLACFIFLLFASLYRKRSTAPVRFWMLGWLFILLHFASLCVPVQSPVAESLQGIVVLGSLVCCGIAFVLSREESRRSPATMANICLALGIPWIGGIVLGCLPHPWFLGAAFFAYLGAVAMVVISVRLFREKPLQVCFIMMVATGCVTWLTLALQLGNADLVSEIILTECFGLNAVLLSTSRPKLSSATATTAFGAVTWGVVWVSAEIVKRFHPEAVVSPEVWNLPKYFVAAGMILILLEEEIQAALHQAHHDVLTELPNRSLFESKLQDALAQTNGKIAIYCIDLDRFKQINDSFGHSAGDLCLKEVAARISRRLQHRGTLARRGGDEFTIFLHGFEDVAAAEEFARNLLLDLKAPIHFDRGELEVGASVGFAIYPDDGMEAEQLWRDADAAMYQAKRAGGGQWVRVSHEISSSATQASEVELALHRALRSGELELHYQPQMLLDGCFHSMEALLRSQEPVLRGTPVDRIIAIAEESGLIVPLGNWVLEEVCRQSRIWMDEGLAPVRIALNVSPLQLTRFDFSRHVANTLAHHQLNAKMLEFEVTESTMMPERGGDAPHQIAMLAALGIGFSVDDFGTGYSSLGRLHQLPVEALKIDCSFTRAIAQMNGTFPTVEAIIELAHTFGMKVVAEGVETAEQLRILKTLGCDRVQGYLFSRPLSSEAATAFLRSMENDLARLTVA